MNKKKRNFIILFIIHIIAFLIILLLARIHYVNSTKDNSYLLSFSSKGLFDGSKITLKKEGFEIFNKYDEDSFSDLIVATKQNKVQTHIQSPILNQKVLIYKSDNSLNLNKIYKDYDSLYKNQKGNTQKILSNGYKGFITTKNLRQNIYAKLCVQRADFLIFLDYQMTDKPGETNNILEKESIIKTEMTRMLNKLTGLNIKN